jgi:plasmid stability protein
MATLYVENVPDDLYEAIRKRARDRRSSIAAEVISVLREKIPTAEELKARQKFLRLVKRMQSKKPLVDKQFPSTEEMLREDRLR